MFFQMCILLLLLACLAHHALARRVQKRIDDQDEHHAIAALLLANPLLSREALRTGGPLRTRRPMMQMQSVRTEIKQAQRQMFDGMDEVPPNPYRPVRTEVGQAPGEMLDRMGGVDPLPNRQLSKPNRVSVQGGTLKTWHYASASVDRVQVVLTTEGRPLDADLELWQGPDNTPVKMRVYSDDGGARPFSTVIETPRSPNTVAIRNIGQVEFPLDAFVIANDVDEPISDFRAASMIVQGGSLRTYPFDPTVESVEVMLRTDGRPLNARIELLQGPNTNKQVIELYTEDGLDRPFFAILETFGSGTVIRLVNTAPLEFPLIASVQPHTINTNVELVDTNPVVGGNLPLDLSLTASVPPQPHIISDNVDPADLNPVLGGDFW